MSTFLVLAVMQIFLNSACIQRSKDDPTLTTKPALYNGFFDYEPGMWVVYKFQGGAKIRLDVVGKETFEDGLALGFEISLPEVEDSVTQAWFSSSGELVRFLTSRGVGNLYFTVGPD
jgi:hypothetical protein